MKHTTRKFFFSALAGTLTLAASNVQAQCTTWVNPNATSGWVDFNSQFGGAPVPDAGDICPVNEISAFEVFADEAYAMDNIQQGVTYTWSACNGTGGSAWPLYFTIIAPSGAVDAFGLNDGSNCALTWTASESGAYIIAVSEDGACGTSSNQGTSNGFPAITCAGAAAISEVAAASSFSISPNPSNGMVTINLEGVKTSSRDVLEVMEISGRRVLSMGVKAGEAVKQLDLSWLPAGSYLVNLVQEGRTVREKLLLVNN